MPDYARTPSTAERSSRYPTGLPAVVCLSCGDTMKHFRTIFKFEMRPERLIFVCPSCQAVDNKELKRVA